MFEKFTDRARKVVQLANSEARRLQHEYLGAEHILLGLVKEGSGVAAYVLKDFGVTLRDARAAIDKHITTGPEPYIIGPDDKLPHHPEVTRVLNSAVAEAKYLCHDYVGTEHILLGLLREKEGIVSAVMADLGLKIDGVRESTLNILGHGTFVTEGSDEALTTCVVCGKPTPMLGTRRCNNCWEVERRLGSYIESPAGRAYVESLLNPTLPTRELEGDYSAVTGVVEGEIKTRAPSKGEEDSLPTDPPAIPNTSDGSKVYLLHYDELTGPGRVQKIVAVYICKQTAHEAVLNICKTPESRRAFFDSFGWPQPSDIQPGNFWVEAFPLKRGVPLLDDWYLGVDGHYHPGWNYEAVLQDNNVTVEWGHQCVDSDGNISELPPELCGWAFSWKHGAIHIGRTTEKIARKAAATFVRLWQIGVSASFADKLMGCYIHYLERQENVSLTFLAEIDHYGDARPFFRLTRGDWPIKRDAFTNTEWKIIDTLAPTDDEEIIVTFTKRKRS